jgi:hypothetical protein
MERWCRVFVPRPHDAQGAARHFHTRSMGPAYLVAA